MNNLQEKTMFNNTIKRKKSSVKLGDMFPNKYSDDPVELTGYLDRNNLKVKFSDGRIGYGSVAALKGGTIKPE